MRNVALYGVRCATHEGCHNCPVLYLCTCVEVSHSFSNLNLCPCVLFNPLLSSPCHQSTDSSHYFSSRAAACPCLSDANLHMPSSCNFLQSTVDDAALAADDPSRQPRWRHTGCSKQRNHLSRPKTVECVAVLGACHFLSENENLTHHFAASFVPVTPHSTNTSPPHDYSRPG